MHRLWLLPCLLPMFLSGCAPGGGEPVKEGGMPGATSSHFAAVSSQIDTGGTLFTYVDFDGDYSRIAASLDALLELVRENDPENSFRVPPDMTFEKLAAPLGLGSVAAFGMSSVAAPDGNTFRNKTFLYTPGGRRGLLSLTGGEAHRLRVLEFAPAGSDFVYEQEIDLRALREVYLEISQRLGEVPPDPPGGLDLGNSFRSALMKAAEILGKTDGRVLMVGKTVPGVPFPLPAPGLADQPALDFIIVLENVPWLFEDIEKLIPAGSEDLFERTDTDSATRYAAGPSLAEGTIYAPVLMLDKKTGQIILATRQEFITECHAAGPKLGSDPEYLAVAEGLPTEGNAVSYTSEELVAVGQALVSAGVELGLGATIEAARIREVLEVWVPGLYSPGASVTVNRDDGIFTVSNAAYSHKRTLLAFANPLGGAASSLANSEMFGSLIPAFGTADEDGQPPVAAPPAAIRPEPSDETLQGIYTGLRKYARQNSGFYPATLKDLNPAEHLSQDTAISILSDRGSIFYRGGLTQASPADEVLVGTASSDGSGMRTVILNNGVLTKLPEAEFQHRTDFTPLPERAPVKPPVEAPVAEPDVALPAEPVEAAG